MDTAEIIISITGAALIAFNFWFFFGKREDEPVRATAANSGAAIYACPMHPWITSTDPTANCSVCGMKLVKQD